MLLTERLIARAAALDAEAANIMHAAPGNKYTIERGRQKTFAAIELRRLATALPQYVSVNELSAAERMRLGV